MGSVQLPIRDVTVPRIPRFQSEMQFRCLSPIVMSTVREHDGKQAMHYCRPDDPALSDLIRQNLIRKHEAILGRIPSDDTLTFAFDKDYIDRRQGTRHPSRGLQGHQDKRRNVSIPCLWQCRIDPNRLRMRFR